MTDTREFTDRFKAVLLSCIVGPQNAPLHNMLLLVAYCVPCIHNMLRWSILCTLHTQYATRGAYCVGSVHMLFQWSSEGTQYALLKNMSRGMFAFLSNCPLDIHLIHSTLNGQNMKIHCPTLIKYSYCMIC